MWKRRIISVVLALIIIVPSASVAFANDMPKVEYKEYCAADVVQIIAELNKKYPSANLDPQKFVDNIKTWAKLSAEEKKTIITQSLSQGSIAAFAYEDEETVEEMSLFSNDLVSGAGRTLGTLSYENQVAVYTGTRVYCYYILGGGELRVEYSVDHKNDFSSGSGVGTIVRAYNASYPPVICSLIPYHFLDSGYSYTYSGQRKVSVTINGVWTYVDPLSSEWIDAIPVLLQFSASNYHVSLL